MQAQNIAHIDTYSVFVTMPEYLQMKRILDDLTVSIGQKFNELTVRNNNLTDELNKLNKKDNANKIEDLQKSISEIRIEIEELQIKSKIEFENRTRELTIPINKKIKEAVEIVCKEKQIKYVLDKATFIFAADDAIDITPDVMSILGLSASFTFNNININYVN